MKRLLTTLFASVFAAAMWTLPAHAANTAQPGMVNYAEGQAFLSGQPLTGKSAGNTELLPGQTLATESGKVEVLLTPGVFLRVDDNSSVRMISPGLMNTEVEVQHGRAMVEVDELHKANNLRVREDGATAQLVSTGLYDFDANQGQVRVFKGKAEVLAGDRTVEVKGGHELTVTQPAMLKAQKFDKKLYENDLYAWSNLRSSYLAEANANAAQVYYVNNGWWGPGWYWDPFFSTYTFLPGSGILYNPFGFGFASPVYAGPVFVPHRRAFFIPRQRFGSPGVAQVQPRVQVQPRFVQPRPMVRPMAPAPAPSFRGRFRR